MRRKGNAPGDTSSKLIEVKVSLTHAHGARRPHWEEIRWTLGFGIGVAAVVGGIPIVLLAPESPAGAALFGGVVVGSVLVGFVFVPLWNLWRLQRVFSGAASSGGLRGSIRLRAKSVFLTSLIYSPPGVSGTIEFTSRETSFRSPLSVTIPGPLVGEVIQVRGEVIALRVIDSRFDPTSRQGLPVIEYRPRLRDPAEMAVRVLAKLKDERGMSVRMDHRQAAFSMPTGSWLEALRGEDKSDNLVASMLAIAAGIAELVVDDPRWGPA